MTPATGPALSRAIRDWLCPWISAAVRVFVRTCYGLLLSGLAFAVPPNPAAGGMRRLKPDLPGESHVPGFPATPASLTRNYIDAFMRAEADVPDEARMLHAFNHPDMGLALTTFLPRYFSPRLAEPTRKLARSPDPAVQAGAIGGLISLLDTTPETRTFVRGLLGSPRPVVRGHAAEYLCWFGIPEDYRFLTRSSVAERDLHARAAMIEAAAAIKRRASVFRDGPAANPTAGATAAETYQQLANALTEQANTATRERVIGRLRLVEVVEPVTRYSDRLDHGARGEALLTSHRLLAGYPAATAAIGPPASLPGIRALVPPVRDYFDPKRKSYGLLIEQEGTPFSGKYHVGDDCAWQKDHETVVAIGDGIVRLVDLGRRSWGGLVVVEHATAAGKRFCSLYGHLGPLISVRPGQAVRQGQKLGAVGLSYSHANGGYLAHLHFGIHGSAFLRPDRVGEVMQLPGRPGKSFPATVTAVQEDTVEIRLEDGSIRTVGRRADWTTGYLEPEEFNAKTERWTDPQEFLRKFQ
ncbi:MAG: peptidoglycan DD-metalloendopeptidase family protein [Akkermansiaceae bacterium]|nr:peptidoglycan DD-metalloendopeptidase family protein [Akkermansiaceae bacterium]